MQSCSFYSALGHFIQDFAYLGAFIKSSRYKEFRNDLGRVQDL